MQDIISPFFDKRKRLQILISVLVFVGMAVPFKVMVLIEGFTEVRPVNAVPVVLGLLFGPAGAWGCAIGNLISDFFGTFSSASALGFLANFVAAYLPYKLWHFFGVKDAPNVKTHRNLLKYFWITTIAALATAILLACGLDLFFGVWIPQIFWIIFFNDWGFPLFLGLPVFIVLTSNEVKIDITLPGALAGCEQEKALGEGGSPSQAKKTLGYAFLAALVLSEAALLIFVILGAKISASPLMGMAGIVFLAALLGVIGFEENRCQKKARA